MKRSEHFSVVVGKWLNGSSHIFVNDCDHVICDARRVFVDGKSHHVLYVFYCSDEPVNWKIGTYGFAKDKFPLIVPFHKFNPDNIGGSLHHNVVKQQ